MRRDGLHLRGGGAAGLMERIRVADRAALDADKALKHSRLNRGIRRIIQINQQNISHETAQPSPA